MRGRHTDTSKGARTMSNATSSRNGWEAFVRLLSSDGALLDVLLRGARRRYKARRSTMILDPTPAERAEAWRQTVREVVVGAFSDKAVVRLLAKKMRLCKEEAERASKRGASSKNMARSAGNGAANASRRAVSARTTSMVPAQNTSRSPIGKVDSEMSHGKLGERGLRSSPARSLEEKDVRVLPFDPDAGVNDAQQRSLVLLCDEQSTPTFAVDSDAKSAAPAPLELERGKSEDVNGMSVFEDSGGGCLGHQKPPGLVRDGASEGDEKGRYTIPNAAANVNGEAGGRINISSPLQMVAKDRPTSSCIGIGVDLGARSRSDRDDDLLCTSDESATPVLSLSNEDPQAFLARSHHHRAAGSWSSPPATTAKSTRAKAVEAGAIAPLSVGVVCFQSPAREEASTTAAITPSPTGVLVESHASVEDAELGSLLSSFERQVERGAGLIRRFEEAAKPLSVLYEDVKAERGDGKEESGHTGKSTRTPGKQSAEAPSIATNIAGSTEVQVEPTQSVPEPVRIGATPGEVVAGSDGESERAEGTHTAEALLYLSNIPEQPTDRGESITRSLSLGEQNPSPDTNTILDEDDEDYEFTFDDEEMVVGQKKSVQFTDESRWSTHEVRACFEQHELGDLFYTTAELDSMQDEAELEEALERSNALVSRGEGCLDDTAAVGGGNGGLPSFGGNQAPKRRESNGTEENVSSDKISFENFLFDEEDSDYDF